MSRATSLVAAVLIGCFASPVLCQTSRWGSADEPTVKFMTEMEAKWASSNCSPQPDIASLIADDFQGTSTSGKRYGKADAIATDPTSLSRDCRLGEVKVRFFGDSIAVAYGEESRVPKTKDGEAKRCQVWTDTWLKRGGRWQIVAAQDTIVPCALPASGDAAAPARTPTPDEAQVTETMVTMYAALTNDDAEKLHAVVTPDYYAFDGGRRFTADELLALVKRVHAAGNVYVWRVTEPEVHVHGDLAWIAYVNRGSVQDASGRKDATWLESAVLHKIGGTWKIGFFHATRVP